MACSNAQFLDGSTLTDLFFPIARTELLRTGIPNAEIVVLEESGHGVELQSADLAKYRDAVRTCLARIPKWASDL